MIIKRIGTFLLVIAVCMVAVMPAMAEIVYQQSGISITRTLSIESGPKYPKEILNGTELIVFREPEYVGLMDSVGNIVVPADYLSIKNSSIHDYFEVEKYNELDDINNKGIIDMTGNVLIPFQYGDISILSKKWCVGYRLAETEGDRYDYISVYGGIKYIILDCTIYNMESKTVAGILDRKKCFNPKAYGDYLFADNNDKTIVYNSALEPVGTSTAPYGYVIKENPDDGTYEVLIDGVDEKIFVTDYEITGADDNYIWVMRDGMGLMNYDGNLLVPCEYDRIGNVKNGYVMVKKNGLYGISDLKGNLIVECKYENIHEIYNSGDEYVFVQGYCPVTEGDYVGYVNIEGKETCALTFADVNPLILACCAVTCDYEGVFTLIAADGTVTKTDYKDIGRISEDMSGRLYWACDQNERYGIIDWHGNVVIPFEYDRSESFHLSDLGTTLVVICDDGSNPDQIFTIQYDY